MHRGRIPAMSESSASAELIRLQCLQALGITVYHPRFRLPGAKPSVMGPWSELVTAAEGASVADRVPVVERVAVVESAPRVESLRSAAAPAEQRAPQRPAPVASSTQAVPRAAENTQAVVQNFQLLFLQVDDDLAIINQIPALARPQLQDKQLALLTNLLRWLGKSMPAQTPRMFRWPLPGLEHMAASMNAATSLLHFLEQASSERGFRFLLQLGPQALAPDAPAWQSFSTHSLDEMLALPALKREVWQSLLPLHAQLEGKS